MTTPQPFPKIVPDASASNALHFPSLERILSFSYKYPTFIGNRNATPPAKAMSHSPFNILCDAKWTATKELEHAV
ncbi:hypothetical protein D3C85_1360730 [compost metagenome]